MEELTMDELLSGKVTREKNAGRESAMNNYQKRVFFEEHILPHYEGLYYFALKTMQHKESAEDAVQSTLERAWKHIDKLKDETKAKTWLFTIARNQMYTILSKRKSRGECELTEGAIKELELRSPQPDLLKLLIQEENREIMAEAMSHLKEKYRTLLELRYYWCFSEKDIAKITGMKYSTVRVYIGRALKDLQKYYNEMEGGERD